MSFKAQVGPGKCDTSHTGPVSRPLIQGQSQYIIVVISQGLKADGLSQLTPVSPCFFFKLNYRPDREEKIFPQGLLQISSLTSQATDLAGRCLVKSHRLALQRQETPLDEEGGLSWFSLLCKTDHVITSMTSIDERHAKTIGVSFCAVCLASGDSNDRMEWACQWVCIVKTKKIGMLHILLDDCTVHTLLKD